MKGLTIRILDCDLAAQSRNQLLQFDETRVVLSVDAVISLSIL